MNTDLNPIMDVQPTLLEAFDFLKPPLKCLPYGDGHINDTYRLTDGTGTDYLLQRINTNIFTSPEALMANIVSVTDFIRAKGSQALTLYKTTSNTPYLVDKNGNFWRLYAFIHALSPDTQCSHDILKTVGEGFGDFLSQLNDFPAHTLHSPIPNFHHTPMRYEHLKRAFEEDPFKRAHAVTEEFSFVTHYKDECYIIHSALESGDIPTRVTHNDTKVNNVLIDPQTHKVMCIVDLDTLMPGSALYDYGDGIRSSVSFAPEDELDLSRVFIDFERFEAFTLGYLKGARGVLTQREIELLPMGALLMTLECGMRFLTDYLEGDHYFKTQRADHNLDRARTQFKLVQAMSMHFKTLQTIIATCAQKGV